MADARFAKPLDTDLVEQLARNHPVMITLEEGSIGGFASFVLDHLVRRDLTQKLTFRPMFLPDRFQDQDKPARQYAEAGLDAAHIVATAMAALA